jgi:hypothetical protein
MTKVYVGDIGTDIILDTTHSLVAATAVSIEVLKPDSTTASWAASVTATTKVHFVSVAGTFDVAGIYRLQAKATLPSGVWLGETVELTVYTPFT